MADTDRSVAASGEGGGDALDRLAASAAGWHRIQLAVLGFIGFCGILWDSGGSAAPAAVQRLAGVLVALAFILACVAIFLVGRVAYPFYGPAQDPGPAREPTVAGRTQRLRTGIRITYLAVGVLVVATLSSWWPPAAPDNGPVTGAVEVIHTAGHQFCGHLVDAGIGRVGLSTADGTVTIPVDEVASVRPVRGC